MKNHVIICAIICATNYALAQEKAHIVYEEILKVEIPKIEGADSVFLSSFPNQIIQLKELYYDSSGSIFRNVLDNSSEPQLMNEGSEGVIIKMQQPDEKVYLNATSKTITEQRDLMGKKFLIQEPIKSVSWKLTGKQKTILNYVCQEVVIEENNQQIKIWFTPEIALPYGPSSYLGFPGMVLGVEFDGGKYQLFAKSINTEAFSSKLIEAPTEGKKITAEKFENLVIQKQKEMQEQYGGEGNTVIIKQF
jgi:GLPGLI family protein